MQNIRKLLRQSTKVTLLTLLGLSSLSALDVPTYYEVDIKSMQISIEGSESVLAHLKSGADIQEQYALDDQLQERLTKLFESVGSTPSKHAGYYMKHQKEVQAYYENNSTLQEKYVQLKYELETINKQIKTLREAQR